MSQGNLPSAVGHQFESQKRNPNQVRFFESRSKTPLEWVEYYSKQLPGPGQYSPTLSRPSTGKFSTARPMGYIDHCIRKGQRNPGPFEYPQPGLGDANARPGGQFSTSFPKNFIDLECYRANTIPGPKYKLPERDVTGLFGRMSEARPKTAVEWLVYDAKSKPGPGEYKVKGKTRKDCKPASGGKFGKGNPKSFIELEELRTSDHPAPDSYRINKLGLKTISFKMKEQKRTYCSRDRLFSQLQALDQMSRKKRLTAAEKKKRRDKKKSKRLKKIRENAKARAKERARIASGGEKEHQPSESSSRVALYSTKKLLQYKITKLDQVYARYT
jgi:hypothetical protein